jgi:hypothetical protein
MMLALVMAAATLVWNSTGLANAAPLAADLVPTWENGILVVRGSRFGPRESITIMISVSSQPISVRAGVGGDFVLKADMDFHSGQRVDLQAQGDQGTAKSIAFVVPDQAGNAQTVSLLPDPSPVSTGDGAGTSGSAPTPTSAATTPAEPAIGEVSGPGQAARMPAALCPRTVACRFAEFSDPRDGYRVQALEICGANCTTQYWMSTVTDGQQILEIDPVRGGGLLTVKQAAPGETHPAVRTVLPIYAPNDAACCPSAFADTTYTWDTVTGTLVAGEPSMIPSGGFVGWDAMRVALANDGFVEIVAGL